MATNSSNDRLVSNLPLHIFDKLASHRRAKNPIDAAALRQQIISKLQTNADDGNSVTTIRQLVKISPPALLRILDPCLTYVECNRWLSRIHRECAARPLSALDMIRRTQTEFSEQSGDTPSYAIGKIPTGLPTLDSYLHGGIPIGSIAEVVGRAGVGKTHLAQQLCVVAAKLNGGAVYIDAEKKLSLLRLREIAFERYLADQNDSDAGQQPPQERHAHELAQRVLENVSVHGLLTTRELMDLLDGLEDEIILRNSQAAACKQQRENTANASSTGKLPVRLIVIDSIAAPIKRDFDMMGSSSNTAAHRASAIFQIAKRLKQLAYDYQLAVVVVNQVGSGNRISNRNDSQRNNTLDISDGEFTASLGTAWQYCVTTRIVLEHEDDPHRLQQEQFGGGGSSVRMATLAKSLVSKRAKLPFELTKSGLCESPSTTT